MVNNLTDRPLYRLEVVQQLAQQGLIKVITTRAQHDIENLGWDDSDVAQLVCALTPKHFRKRFVCNVGNGSKIVCDDYRITYDEEKLTEMRDCPEFYVKFAIGATGQLLLIVSCHLSR